MQSIRGRAIHYLDPQPEDFEPDDIAVVLSRQPRFVGHTKFRYSVAQHSVLVAKLCPDPFAGLLHDVHEMVVGDVSTPLKQVLEFLNPGFRDALKSITDLVDAVLMEKYGVGKMITPEVKHADLRALATEKRDIMLPPPRPWLDLPMPDDEVIEYMTEDEAREAFLTKFYELCPRS